MNGWVVNEEIRQGFVGVTITVLMTIILFGFVVVPVAEATIPGILDGPFHDAGIEMIRTINVLPGLLMGGMITAVYLVLATMGSGFGVR